MVNYFLLKKEGTLKGYKRYIFNITFFAVGRKELDEHFLHCLYTYTVSLTECNDKYKKF